MSALAKALFFERLGGGFLVLYFKLRIKFGKLIHELRKAFYLYRIRRLIRLMPTPECRAFLLKILDGDPCADQLQADPFVGSFLRGEVNNGINNGEGIHGDHHDANRDGGQSR